jgi:hypothetical protein
MDRRTIGIAIAYGAALALAVPALSADAQPMSRMAMDAKAGLPQYLPVPRPMMQDGIPFMSGGVGIDARKAMESVASDYNLRLSFAAARDHHYVVDVDVVIADASGKPILDVADAGPLLYAQLPPGRYEVTATMGAERKTRMITVGNRPMAANFQWDARASDIG